MLSSREPLPSPARVAISSLTQKLKKIHPNQPINKQTKNPRKTRGCPWRSTASRGAAASCSRHGRAGRLHRGFPAGLPCRGLPGRSRTEPRVRQGQERLSGSRGCRPASAFPSLSCRALAKPVRASQDTASDGAGTGRAAALPARDGGTRTLSSRADRGTGDLECGICEGSSSAEPRRWLRAVRSGLRRAGAGGCRGRAERKEPCCGLPAVCSLFSLLSCPGPSSPCARVWPGGLPCPVLRCPRRPCRGKCGPGRPGVRGGSALLPFAGEDALRRELSSAKSLCCFIYFFKQTFSHLWSLPRFLFFPSPCNLLI